MIDVPCMVCGSRASTDLWTLRRDTHLEAIGVAGTTVRKVMCRGCGLVYSRPRLSHAELSTLYSTFRTSDTPSPRHLAAKQQLAEDDARWLLAQTGVPGDVLEIGSSEGSFLNRLRLAGSRTIGVEPSSFGEYGRRTYGLDIRRGLFEEMAFEPASRDLVVALRVLEHAGDPRAFLARAGVVLRPGGLLYLEVPSAWKPRHALEEFLGAQHLWLFTAGSLIRLLGEHGFTPVALDERGRGLRILARLTASATSGHRVAGAQPSAAAAYRLRMIYARHRVKYFWKTRARPPLAAAARRIVGKRRT